MFSILPVKFLLISLSVTFPLQPVKSLATVLQFCTVTPHPEVVGGGGAPGSPGFATGVLSGFRVIDWAVGVHGEGLPLPVPVGHGRGRGGIADGSPVPAPLPEPPPVPLPVPVLPLPDVLPSSYH